MGETATSLRRVPVLVSVLIAVFAGGFYVFSYLHQREYLTARNSRLLTIAESSLTVANADSTQLTRSATRRGDLLRITLGRSRPTPRFPEWQNWLSLAEAGFEPGYTISLSRILEHLPMRAEAFDLVAVADTDRHGTVIAQEGETTLKRQHLEGLVDADSKLPISTAALWQSSLASNVTIGGITYKLFSRPVSYPHFAEIGAEAAVGPPEAREGLVFCGLVSERRFSREAMSISPLAIAGILAALALTFLAAPFLKVALLGPSERFRFTDACALALCTFLGLFILATAVVDIAFILGMSWEGDRSLKRIAVQIHRNLFEEIGEIAREASRVDARYAANPKTELCANALGLPSARRIAGSAAECPAREPNEPAGYPYYELAAWIDRSGEQVAKWTNVPLRRPMRFPVERDYFAAVRDDRLWSLRSSEASAPFSAFVESVRALTSGEPRAVVSVPSSGNSPYKPIALAITTSLVSLTRPVLPPAVGFCIIDRHTGRVLFHSDPDQALTHNLFDETDQDSDLRAAVQKGTREQTTARYWGQRHRFHVEPLSPAPWALLVFRNNDLLRAANVEILEDSVGLGLVYVLVVYVACLMYLVFKPRQVGWLWPQDERALAYLQLFASFVSVALLFALALHTAGIQDSIRLGFTLPLAAVIAAVLTFELRRRQWPATVGVAVVGVACVVLLLHAFWAGASSAGAFLFRAAVVSLVWVMVSRLEAVDRARKACESRFSRSLRKHYLLPHYVAAVLFWLLIAVLPAVAFVRSAAAGTMQLLARDQADSFAQQEERRNSALRMFYDYRLDAAGEDAWFAKSRQQYARDLYRIGMLDTDASSALRWSLGDALQFAHDHKPLLDRAALRFRHVPSFAQPVSAIEEAGEPVGVVAAPSDRAASSASPRLSFWRLLGAWPAAALLAVVGLLVVWVRWSARNLLLAAIEVPRGTTLEQLKRGLQENAICVVPSWMDVDRLFGGDWCERITVRGAAAVTPKGPAGRPLVIDHLALESTDRRSRRALLSSLEGLVAKGDRRVYLVASVHPADVLIGAHGTLARQATALPPEEADRWIRLLSSFSSVTLQERRSHPRDGEAWHSPRTLARFLLSDGTTERSSDVDFLARELEGSTYVRRLVQRRLEAGSLAHFGRDDVVTRIRDVAWSYYWSLWSSCAAEEKLALVHLCEESFVNPKQTPIVKRLILKGLVVKDPMLRPMSESFASFVCAIRNPQQVREWEAACEGFGWKDMRLPLVTIASVCAFLLFLSQRDLFDSTMLFVSALGATGVPALARLAGTVKAMASVATPSARANG
jgi:drug/metabolite transporter (DMT)-like permease